MIQGKVITEKINDKTESLDTRVNKLIGSRNTSDSEILTMVARDFALKATSAEFNKDLAKIVSRLVQGKIADDKLKPNFRSVRDEEMLTRDCELNN